MVKCFLLVLIFVNFNINAQQIKVQYGLVFGDFKKLVGSGNLSERFNKNWEIAAKNADQIDFFLDIYDNKAKFYKVYSELDKKKTRFAIVFSGTSNDKFVDLNSHTVRYNSGNTMMGMIKKNEFTIIDTVFYNWNITNEEKLINNYKCYKATLVIYKEEKEKSIIAWFCPELPYSFGPKEYFGLPGLILELSEENYTFGLIKISFDQIVDVEQKNVSEKIFNSTEFLEFQKKLYLDFKNNKD